MSCFLFFHSWKLKIQHYIDVSYGGQASSTKVIKICQKCHAVKEKSYYGIGFLTPEELGFEEDKP